MKRFMAVFLMLAILLTGLTVTANAATTGWKKLDDGTWTYVKADGKLAENEWIKDGSSWYYFDGTTMVADDWMQIKGKWYAFAKSGAMADNGWFSFKEGSETYWVYAAADGALAEEWKKIDGVWYYFQPIMASNGTWWMNDKAPYEAYCFEKSGAMVSNNWFHDPWWDCWFYCTSDGVTKKGWFQDGDKWYYLEPNFGVMQANQLIKMTDGKTYGFKKSGEMVTGWEKFDGIWYYFKDSGAMTTSEWVKGADGKWYYLKDSGEMAKSETLTIKGKEYKFGADGAWIEK